MDNTIDTDVQITIAEENGVSLSFGRSSVVGNQSYWQPSTYLLQGMLQKHTNLRITLQSSLLKYSGFKNTESSTRRNSCLTRSLGIVSLEE